MVPQIFTENLFTFPAWNQKIIYKKSMYTLNIKQSLKSTDCKQIETHRIAERLENIDKFVLFFNGQNRLKPEHVLL